MAWRKLTVCIILVFLLGTSPSIVDNPNKIESSKNSVVENTSALADKSQDEIVDEETRKSQNNVVSEVDENLPAEGVIVSTPDGSPSSGLKEEFRREGFKVAEGSFEGDFVVENTDYNKVKQIIEEKNLLASAEPNYIYELMLNANDYYYPQQKAYLRQIKATSAWDYSTGRNSTVVAVVDTGVRGNHEDLSGRLINGYNAITGSAISRTSNSDDNGHGTAMAGIIAANTNNSVGVAGIDWSAKIMPVKSFNSSGTATATAVARGVRWAANSGADIINMSFGGSYSSTIETSIEYAAGHGKILIAASGNSGSSSVLYPASSQYVIAVGSVNSSGQRSSFSNYGSGLTVVAPGENLITTSYTGSSNYITVDGTSGACAVASGVAALGEGWHLRLGRVDMTNFIIQATGTSHNNLIGYGVIDSYRLLTAVGSYRATTIARSSQNITLDRGENRRTFSYTARNNGPTTWDSRILRLGTSSPNDRISALVRRGTGWRSPTRVRMGSSQVLPGETTTFTFDYAAGYDQQPGLYHEQFCLVADGIMWLNTCTAWNVNVSNYQPGYHYEYIAQSPNPTVSQGGTAEFILNIRNTGSKTWTRASKVRLGTSHPQDRYIRNPFERITHFINPARVEMANDNVEPGEIASFKFKIKASTATHKGKYTFYFTPVVDGVQWMEDKGIYWDMTVQ